MIRFKFSYFKYIDNKLVYVNIYKVPYKNIERIVIVIYENVSLTPQNLPYALQ